MIIQSKVIQSGDHTGAMVQPTLRNIWGRNSATQRRLVREPERCRGAFKDPFHGQPLEGSAYDEWFSALLQVGGLDRRHVALSLRVCHSVWVFVHLCLPPSQKKGGLKLDDGTVLSSVMHAASEHRHHCAGEPLGCLKSLAISTSLFHVMQRCLSSKHLTCFKSPSALSQNEDWTHKKMQK